MPRKFSEEEKEIISNKLIKECEISWSTIGYRNTKIEDLCAKVGISKGGFYSFFDSKEHLFCRTHDILQEGQRKLQETLPDRPVKEDIARILKQEYLLYAKEGILSQRNTPDFISFLSRAPQEWIERSKKVSEDFINYNIFNPNLKLKMSKEKTIGIFNALLLIVTSKDILGYDHYEIFCTLLDNIIGEVYE